MIQTPSRGASLRPPLRRARPAFSPAAFQSGPRPAIPPIGPAPPFSIGGGATWTAPSAPSLGANEDLLFLLDRATNGYSISAYQEAQAMGYQAWLDAQLDWENVDDSEVEALLANLPTLSMSAEQLFLNYPDDQVVQVVFELQVAVLIRAIYSRRQLYERMVELWTDHFNISQLDDLCLWFKTVDDREVIRRHALGRFPELLAASARSSAMSWYLDNYANVAGAAQENYARELLELHTLGVDGPYTEYDVREVARCFTGWTFHGVYTAGPFGEFVFVPEVHDNGPKVVLGEAIPAGGGVTDGLRVLRILAEHPATAEFVARKICRWLLAYEPPQTLVDRIKNIYLSTGGDIAAMVHGALQPGAIAAVPAEDRLKLRRPYHFVLSLMRAAQVYTSDPLQITSQLVGLGQVPYFWPAPNGYPDSLGAWGSAVLPRWTFASAFFRGEIPGNVPDYNTLLLLLQNAPPSQVGAAIGQVLTGGTLSATDVAGVQAFVDSQPALTEPVLREAFALAASSPSYQYY